MESGLRILLITTLAWLIIRIVDVTVNRLERQASAGTGHQAIENAKRVRTLGNLVENIVGVFVTVAAAADGAARAEPGHPPVLTGAGILGLAVGFGAQSIVKDVISGFFMILENQVRVGDVAVINGVGGAGRIDHAAHDHAARHRGHGARLPQRQHHHAGQQDEGLLVRGARRRRSATREDTDRVIEVLKQRGRRDLGPSRTFRPSMLEPLEMFGVDSLAESAVTIKIRFKTLPLKQWEVARELRRRIKKALRRARGSRFRSRTGRCT